jgi:hypothetical protein
MKSRLFLLALLPFLALSALPGQEGDEPEPEPELFCLSLLLEAAVSGEIPWQPDWPAAMPPDSFALISGRAAAMTLVLPKGHLEAAPAEDDGESAAAGAGEKAATEAEEDGAKEEETVEYRLVWDGAGRFLEFPYFVNGALYQARAEYTGDGPGEAGKISLDNPAAPDPWEFEILEYRQGAPALARISHGGAWRFAAPEYLETRTNETWHDADGAAQGFFALEYRLQDGARRLVSTDRRSDQDRLIMAYDYNSAGRVSGISAPEGEYAALYNAAARPRYWERPGEAYALQWNGQGLLVRLSGTLGDAASPDETGGAAEPRRIDMRYDYVLDERGNWIERRETSFVRRFGRLVSDSEGVIRRTITYGD